jgi:hypothetical protein
MPTLRINLNEHPIFGKTVLRYIFSTYLTKAINIFCAIVLYLVVYHVCFQDGKLCLLVANDKLDGK